MGFDIDLLGPPNEDPEGNALAHHGVKGMKWGVINEDPPMGPRRSIDDVIAEQHSFSVEAYMSGQTPAATNKTVELRKNQEKFLSKSDPDGPVAEGSPPDGLSPAAKQRLVKMAVGGLAVGAVVGYSAYKIKQNPELRWNVLEFHGNVAQSKASTWNSGKFIQPSSFDREGFTLPAGHTFNRISRVAESGFNPPKGVYATASTEDFHRYVIGFRRELGHNVDLHHVTWTAKEPIKVPDLKTTLDSLKTAMVSQGYSKSSVTPEMVQRKYEMISGGKWDDELSTTFFNVLKKRGFGAIVDEMDAGVIGEKPLVVFAHDKMNEKVSQPMTKESIARAASLLKDFPAPPRKVRLADV